MTAILAHALGGLGQGALVNHLFGFLFAHDDPIILRGAFAHLPARDMFDCAFGLLLGAPIAFLAMLAPGIS